MGLTTPLSPLAIALTLNILSLAGTAVFAVSGALMALRKDMDIVGISFIATLTGVGGGTMRDLLLGVTPVHWVKNPVEIMICLGATGLTMLFNKQITGRRERALIWADAIGLALFSVLGAAKAQALGAHPLVVVLFGAMSACFGGIIRDVICNEIPVLFRREIYITAALLGATVLLVLPASWPFALQTGIAALSAFILRALAIHYNWSLRRPL